MQEIELIKIENKIMPKDNFKDVDFDVERSSQAGFTNLIFLAGAIITAFMWAILLIIGK